LRSRTILCGDRQAKRNGKGNQRHEASSTIDDAKPDAVRFVEQLRETETAWLQEDRYKHIPPLPVVVYSGKQYSKLLDYTQSVRGAEPIVVVAQGLEAFLIDVLRILSHVRSEPSEIVVGPSPADNNGA
jgi:hypothetical protein